MAYITNQAGVYSGGPRGYRGETPRRTSRIVMNTNLPLATADGYIHYEMPNHNARYNATVHSVAVSQHDKKPPVSGNGLRFSLGLCILVGALAVVLLFFAAGLIEVGHTERSTDQLRASVNGYTQEYNTLQEQYAAAQDVQLQNLAQQALDLGMTRTDTSTTVSLVANPDALYAPNNLY